MLREKRVNIPLFKTHLDAPRAMKIGIRALTYGDVAKSFRFPQYRTREMSRKRMEGGGEGGLENSARDEFLTLETAAR